LRSLSGLAAAGLKLDKYGLLQLSSPNLSDVLSTLLAVVLVLRVFVKHTVSVMTGGGLLSTRLAVVLVLRVCF
jgi:hypothetical protein